MVYETELWLSEIYFAYMFYDINKKKKLGDIYT